MCLRRRVVLLDLVLLHEVVQHGECHVRTNRAGTIAEQQGCVHHLTNLTALHNQSGLHTLLHTDEVMMHRTHRQQARDGSTLLVDVSIGKDDVVHALIDRCLSLLAEVFDGLTQSAGALLDVEQHGELLGLEALVADVAEDVQLRVRQHWLWQTHHLAVAGVGGQDVRAHCTDVLGQRHHQFLTYRVDGRVRHLRKLLSEVVEEYLRTVRDHCQWRVVTHRCHRLLTCCRHRHNRLVDVLLTETEVDELPFIILHRVLHVATALQLLQLDAVRREPFAVWMSLRELLLDLSIIIYLALLRVDEQNLTGLKTALAHHVIGFKVHHTDLGCHDHHAALRNRVAAGTQTVSVEHTTCITTVGEQQCGRTVPRLHQDRMVLIERLQILADRVLVVEALWHENRHCLGQTQSAHDQELKHVVEAGRVTHALLHNRTDILDVTQCLAAQHAFTRLHPTAVSTDGVDLTIVRQETERLCQTPCWECVGTEA